MKSAHTNTPHVVIACGGTGGHLFPGVAVADEFVARGCEVSLLISPKEVDQQAVKSTRGVKVFTLPAVGLQGGNYFRFALGFWKSLCAAKKLFHADPPHAVLAMGGFTSAPPVLAARSVGARTFLHESNTIPGRANRWLAKRVDHAFVGFPQAAKRLHARETTVTGTPVRSEFHPRDRVTCSAALKLDPAKPVVLVMGGSQGASGINDLIIAALPRFAQPATDCQWLHLAGPTDVEKIKRAYATHGLSAQVHSFFTQMDLAFGAADMVVSRAGASSLAEIAAVRVPAILVPFPHAADDHQLYNAKAFAETGAALLLEQQSAMPEKTVSMITELLGNSAVHKKMQTALAQWHAPKAADQIAETILKTLAGDAAPCRAQADNAPPTNTMNLKAIA